MKEEVEQVIILTKRDREVQVEIEGMRDLRILEPISKEMILHTEIEIMNSIETSVILRGESVDQELDQEIEEEVDLAREWRNIETADPLIKNTLLIEQ